MARGDEIRRIAYNLWEKEDRPEGRALDHWLRAEAIWVSQHGTQPRSAQASGQDRRLVVSQPPKSTRGTTPYTP
ncbi:MAG TPA: DUF2934 domain-containing protein [Thermoplasmata archaeon]|jgi:hypothetical protein